MTTATNGTGTNATGTNGLGTLGPDRAPVDPDTLRAFVERYAAVTSSGCTERWPMVVR